VSHLKFQQMQQYHSYLHVIESHHLPRCDHLDHVFFKNQCVAYHKLIKKEMFSHKLSVNITIIINYNSITVSWYTILYQLK
jgi:hypothetical protein